MLGYPLELDDLDAYLAYRPWSSESNREKYQKAVEEGGIPDLRDQEASRQASGLEKNAGYASPVFVPSSARGLPNHPELNPYEDLLSSQRTHILELVCSGVSEDDAVRSAIEQYHKDDEWYIERKAPRPKETGQRNMARRT